MTVTENPLRFNGHTYATPAARDAAEAAYARAQEQLEKSHRDRGERAERQLQARFMAAGGSAEQWQKERAGILAKAREQATLAGDDAQRLVNAQRYR